MTVLLVENERCKGSRYGIGKQNKNDDDPEEQVGSDVFHVVCSVVGFDVVIIVDTLCNR